MDSQTNIREPMHTPKKYGGKPTRRRKRTIKKKLKNASSKKRQFSSSIFTSYLENKTPFNQIDTNYNDIIPENDSIVYFLILSHGSVIFRNDTEPDYINMPKNIEYLNKITYAPFGFFNYETNDTLILNAITEKIKTSYSENNTPIVENKLIEGLQNVDCVLQMQKKDFEKNKDNTKYRCGLKMLIERENQLYQSVVYYKPLENNVPIINKSFSISKDDAKDMNIFVVFEKGKDGFLYEGGTVLNSEAYKDFISTSVDDESEIEGLQNSITTEELLEFADFCNYKNVVIIDYSCDGCRKYNGEKVPRNEVIKIRREKIDQKLVGRGSQKNIRKPPKKMQRFSKII